MLVDESTNVTLGDGFTNFMKLVAGCYFHTQFVLNTRMMLSVLISFQMVTVSLLLCQKGKL